MYILQQQGKCHYRQFALCTLIRIAKNLIMLFSCLIHNFGLYHLHGCKGKYNERGVMSENQSNENLPVIGKKLLNISQVCEQLGIGEFTVYKLIHQNRLRSVKIGSRRLVSARAIDEYIALLEEEHDT